MEYGHPLIKVLRLYYPIEGGCPYTIVVPFSTQKKYSRAAGAEIFLANYPSISPPQVPESRSKTVILGISELQNMT